MTFNVQLALCNEIDQIWQHVSRGLEEACIKSGGDLNASHLWSECRSGRAFLALITEDNHVIGASVWRIEQWSTGKKLRCLALYGEKMPEWVKQHREVATWLAKAGGATAFVTEGRRGFERLFPGAKVLRQLYEEQI